MRKGAAIVTGATGVVGREIALSLAEQGYDVVAHYGHATDTVLQVQKQIEARGVACAILQEDFSGDANYAQFMANAKESFDDCRVLINSAALFERCLFQDASESLFDHHINTNVKTCFFLSQYFADIFADGVIINMLDSYMLKNKSPYFVYLLSKKMLYELTRMTACELAPVIRVNAVSLGIIDTDQGKDDHEALMLKKRQCLPMQALPHVSSVTEAIKQLIEHQFYVGQCLYVDGGEHLV